MPALYQAAHAPNASLKTVHRTTYADGTVVEYDRAAHKLTATVVGDVEIASGGMIKATATTAEIITSGKAKIQSTGNDVEVLASGAIKGSSATAEITTTGNAKVQSGAELRLKGATIVLEGPVTATSTVSSTGNITAPNAILAGIPFMSHKHTIPDIGITNTPHT